MKQVHDRQAARKRILSACVRLFLEEGYGATSPRRIFEEAQVSPSSFYNIYPSKSAVLQELCAFMFENQFGLARHVVGEGASGPLLYGVETALQLTLTERNERLREIYTQVYTEPALLDYVRRRTAEKLPTLFGGYLPEYGEREYYETEIGTAGIMSAYMAHKCDTVFTPEQKLRCFLRMSLAAFRVPREERERVVQRVLSLNLSEIADRVMHRLYAELEVRFDCDLPLPEEKEPAEETHEACQINETEEIRTKKGVLIL